VYETLWGYPMDVNETLAYETETSDFCHEARPRPRPCKAETFFETFNLQHCAKTMNGDVQIKTNYIKQYRYLVFTVYIYVYFATRQKVQKFKDRQDRQTKQLILHVSNSFQIIF